ncbi:lipopolysaccharide biosynthesis protein [Arthrobacter psychrochitiniphilus]|uniref:Lipopolysaccharide biosynthesis protein n=1 Tax=Arthrobacter psychrochitiniphilus TaxID=291045 RepID=A0A2V3DVJ4_9MICC|nr:lipopolysaccharide biosynthesis protein [Arthrobacter psychrochitiniphilus]
MRAVEPRVEESGLGEGLGQGLGRRAVHGAAVTVVGQGAKVLLQTLSVIILARLLSPSDYGLFAMVMAVAGVAEIFRDFGLSQAAVQAKTLSREQRDQLFWINTAIGVVLALSVYFGAWLIAAFFRHDELVPLIQALSLVFLVNGAATQFRASLTRSLRFTALAVIDFLSTVVGLAAAIAFALSGFGVWSLVLQVLISSLVVLLASVICSRWLPGRPRRGTQIGGFLRFGWHMVATQVVTYVGNNADTVTIGLVFGAAPLGNYNRPYQLVMNIANQLRSPISNVAIPVLSRLQDAGAKYWEFARVGQLALGYTLVAGLAVATGAAVPITDILLGHEWVASAPILSMLSAAAIFQTLAYFGYWIYVSKGITKALFKFNLVGVGVKVVFLVVGAFWGVNGVAAGYLISTFLKWPLSLYWIARSVEQVPIRMFVTGFLRMSALAGLGAASAFLATVLLANQGRWAQVLVAMAAAVLVYALGLFVPAVRRDVADLLSAASRLRKKQL